MNEKLAQYYNFFKEGVDSFKKSKYSLQVRDAREKILAELKSEKFSIVHPYLRNMNAKGVPFTDDFNELPTEVSQVKTIINTLYHAEVALNDLETINLGGNGVKTVQDLEKLYSHTFDHVDKALSFAKGFDFDFRAMFSKELSVLAPLFVQFQNLSAGFNISQLWSKVDRHSLPHQVGMVAGKMVDQLGGGQPNRDVDYEFLARFSAVLPGYLDQLTGYIKQFSSKVSEYQPSVDKAKLDELQANALELLSALEKTRDTHFFIPIELLHYIRVIRNSIKICKELFEQAGRLNASAQQAICTQLAELQYELLPPLVGFIDKIEMYTMLTPGTLSKPMLAEVSRYYDTVMQYVGLYVDFPAQAPALVTINNAKFLDKRAEETYQRSAEEHLALLQVEVAQSATTQFFLLLNKHQSAYERQQQGGGLVGWIQNQFSSPPPPPTLYSIPDATFERLRALYKQIQSEVKQLDSSLHDELINAFERQNDVPDLPFSIVNVEAEDDCDLPLSKVLALQSRLEGRLKKLHGSHQFHLQLNERLVNAIYNDAEDIKLVSYDAKDHALLGNEVYVLKRIIEAEKAKLHAEPRPWTRTHATRIKQQEARLAKLNAAVAQELDDLASLSTVEIGKLYQSYQIKLSKLERAREAYITFYQIITTPGSAEMLEDLSDGVKKKLRSLYAVFQPYFVEGLSSPKGFAANLDKALVKALEGTTTVKQPGNGTRIASINALHPKILNTCFTAVKPALETRCQVFAEEVRQRVRAENATKVLIKERDTSKRAHYLIKSDVYAKTIVEFKDSLFKFTKLFNSSVEKQLDKKAEEGVPYPELNDTNQGLAQSTQVLCLKRLFNCLYYLEQSMTCMESLRDDHLRIVYIIKVIQVGYHLNNAKTLMEELAKTPGLSIVANEVKDKLQRSYAALMNVNRHYVPAEVEGEADLGAGHSTVLFYTLTALKMIPEHIKSLRATEDLSAEDIRAMHVQAEKTTTNVERILASANADPVLGVPLELILEVPSMFGVWKEFVDNLTKMSTASHDVAMDHLGDINTQLLTKVLLAAHQWEDELVLKPGTVTDALKEMIDSLYQGFVEPIGLKSQRHIGLVTTMSPLEQCLSAAEAREKQAVREQEKIKLKRDPLHRLHQYITTYADKMKVDEMKLKQVAREQLLSQRAAIKALMLAEFQEALPQLKEIQSLLAASIPTASETQKALDEVLNTSVDSGEALIHVEALAAMGASYYEGQYATQQLNQRVAQEKITHLKALKEKQQTHNDAFVVKYTQNSFAKQCKAWATKPVALGHCSKEYSAQLMKFLQSTENEVVALAKQEIEDIDRRVAELLQDKVRLFEQNNYKKYVHLKTILTAFDRMSLYIAESYLAIENNSSAFESLKTLDAKRDAVSTLKTTALDENLPLDARLIALKDGISSSLFAATMLDYQTFEPLTYAWFKQWLSYILECFGYVPEHKKCHQELVEALKEPTLVPGHLTERYGLFASSHARRSYDLPDDAPAPLVEPAAPAA